MAVTVGSKVIRGYDSSGNWSDLLIPVGMSYSSSIAPATTALAALKITPGILWTLEMFNILATPVYLRLYDKTVANITFGTTAADYVFIIPGNTAGAGFVKEFTKGIPFSNAMTWAITNLLPATDHTNITAASVIANFGYT